MYVQYQNLEPPTRIKLWMGHFRSWASERRKILVSTFELSFGVFQLPEMPYITLNFIPQLWIARSCYIYYSIYEERNKFGEEFVYLSTKSHSCTPLDSCGKPCQPVIPRNMTANMISLHAPFPLLTTIWSVDLIFFTASKDWNGCRSSSKRIADGPTAEAHGNNDDTQIFRCMQNGKSGRWLPFFVFWWTLKSRI